MDGMNKEEAVNFMRFAIEATGDHKDDAYYLGLKNGLRLAISFLTGEKPEFETM